MCVWHFGPRFEDPLPCTALWKTGTLGNKSDEDRGRLVRRP
jgi:hypothetical protein